MPPGLDLRRLDKPQFGGTGPPPRQTSGAGAGSGYPNQSSGTTRQYPAAVDTTLQELIVEEVMDYRTLFAAQFLKLRFPAETREGTKSGNRHTFLVNPFCIPC